MEPYTAFDETLADFGRAVNWAAELELRMIISHDPWRHVNGSRAGGVHGNQPGIVPARGGPCAAKQLQLVFEPHPDTLSMQNAWAIEFIDTLAEGHPAGSVGILYDCCHYGVGQPEAYVDTISELGERIRHVHYSDGDRETYALHLAPGDGSLDLRPSTRPSSGLGIEGR
ncbi:MAG: TIM barrel protein [Pirellulales bacterium]